MTAARASWHFRRRRLPSNLSYNVYSGVVLLADSYARRATIVSGVSIAGFYLRSPSGGAGSAASVDMSSGGASSGSSVNAGSGVRPACIINLEFE